MLNKFIRLVAGDPNKRTVEKYREIVEEINALEAGLEALTPEQLQAKTAEFRARLAQGETLDDLLPEAFAAVREASKRTTGLRHYAVQMLGGIALHRGTVAEMRTGEGKTLVATLPVYLNALTGKGAHLITVNDYLARRDARWMAPIYQALGLSVGVLQMATRDQEGPRAYLVDFERQSPHEDQNHLRLVHRREAYAADITYGTNSEFGFDYLRDNMVMRWEDRVQRGHYFAIIDEADNVLIDEARTPLIISGPAQDESSWYERMTQVVRQLRAEDYEVSEKDRNVSLTELGETHVEELLGQPLRDPERPEDITPEQAHMMGYLEQSLRAHFLFRRNKEYLVQAGKIVIVDEFTGRLMHGRRWSDGLHQAVEAKENVKVQPENMTYATVTIQNYFRMYERLAGMTGTAITESEEFDKIYKLQVLAIPTNLEYEAERSGALLVELDAKDDEGYKYSYYARRADSAKKPIYWRRKDYPDVVYRTEEMKFRAITQEILRFHVQGRPVLVGTTSVELSDRLSDLLRADPLQRMAQSMLLRKLWLDKNNREEDGRQVAELQFLYAPLADLPIPEMRKMARDFNVSFNPADPENLARLCPLLGLNAADAPRLEACLKAGVPHEVLNARKHAEEGLIIAQAGAFGAVTIATNMAGRGVDIRLGGDMPVEVTKEVEQLLRRQDIAEKLQQSGLPDVDHLSQRQSLQALDLIDPEELRSRAEAVQEFRSRIEAEEKVRLLGGLHVIGSERHEARRIDNQLRGRSARQGDPGSSRFYLSMEDELMRMFGGDQVDNLMQRLKVDDALPLEVGLVGRLIEQSQSRVEGSNFDVRKHLLEYDDVLNAQRKRIYSQRDRVFLKDDLFDDVNDMLQTEVLRRVPEALKDKGGPWKLAAWLEQIQPSTPGGGQIFASYPLQLVLDSLRQRLPATTTTEAVSDALLGIAAAALESEVEHILHSVDLILEATETRFKEQFEEESEALKNYLDDLHDSLRDEEAQPRAPRQVLEELGALLHQQPRLSAEQQRLLREAPRSLLPELRQQLETVLLQQALARALGAVERRLEEPLELPAQTATGWNDMADRIFSGTKSLLQRRRERLTGNGTSAEGGQIGRELETAFEKLTGNLSDQNLLLLLLQMTQGARTAFDKRTHRKVVQHTTRLTYIFLAGRLMDGKKPDQVAQAVLEHLQRAYGFTQRIFGLGAWPRLAGARWHELQPRMQQRLQESLGESKLQILRSTTCQGLDTEDIAIVQEETGRVLLTEIYRQLLLNVISDLWVDYLTEMEALRLVIRLESYAQRDPLVQYKSRASEAFSKLFNNLRLGVVNRMFTYRPRDFGALSTLLLTSEAAGRLEPAVLAAAESANEVAQLEKGAQAEAAESSGDEDANRGQKRRRRRR